MSQTFGMEKPKAHTATTRRLPARYLVVIDAGGAMVARLYLETRELVAEFDAAVEEVALMTKGLRPNIGAIGVEWDRVLRAHNATERAAAKVYTLDI